MATRKSKPQIASEKSASAKGTSAKNAGAPSVSDPQAPLDSAALLKAATPLLKRLAADLLERADGSPSITRALQTRHAKEQKNERTADNYDSWRRDFVEQVAAAWLLSVVFVRTLEDRGLLGKIRIAGPGALDSQRAFFALTPSLNERDYLLTVFRELQHLPAARELFDARHNPVWLLGPSAEGAKELLALFRQPQAEAPSFRFGHPNSRFLGDLYQDLSENVRKRYALLQTPHFVEQFILDRTLEPALERFGLNDTTLIDPTCGSGHFLLGAFERLFDRRLAAEPGLDVRQAAVKALEAVAGCDINPYAVAIARFRLMLAFLEKGGYTRLKDAPELPLQVVVADSLLHNAHLKQQDFAESLGQEAADWRGSEFQLENEKAARKVLFKQYAAVVGNPPYITVKDAVLRERYRKIYASAFREYSLAVPFKERFFQLARQRGYVGMITANSFMKREFGKRVIEAYLPTVNLETIINTSGAYIPGHGTPTVLLFGSAEKPQKASVLTVLGSRGEPSTPEDPEQGYVWSSIARHWDNVGFENEYISVTRTERTNLGKHPWSLGGGGATELKTLLEERSETRLGDVVDSVGFMCITKQDDVFSQPLRVFSRAGVSSEFLRQFVIGENVRDWCITPDSDVFYPYGKQATLRPIGSNSTEMRFLWPVRTILESRAVFGGKTFREAKRPWYEYGQIPRDRQEGAVITFAFVATHNHFVLDRGGKVFNRSAPIIKLPESATEDDHYALLAYLNSSTAAFLLRQSGHCKGAQGVNEGHKSEVWEQFLEYSGTLVGKLPLPPNWQSLAPLGKTLVAHAEELERTMPRAWIETWATGRASEVQRDFGTAPRRMEQRLVALQEEVDWAVYRLFGLLGKPLDAKEQKAARQLYPRSFPWEAHHDQPCPAELSPGSRPFEQLLDLEATQWFKRNAYPDPIPPEDHPGGMRDLLRVRMAAVEAVPEIRVIEQPEYKHRWAVREVDAEALAAVTEWGCSTLELALHSPVPEKASALALEWLQAQGKRAHSASQLYFGGNPQAWVAQALANNAVPFLAQHRFTDSGLEKHSAWEATWALQRREDAGEKLEDIPVPPKYGQEDYRDPNAWRLRGKLDVPKERFISYPGCESDEDQQPVYGWAGWDHLQRAQALAQLYNARREEGWEKERLIPLLAGLLELMPWLLQWHNQPSEELGGAKAGDQFALFLEGQCAELGLTHKDLRDWRPTGSRSGGRAGSRAAGGRARQAKSQKKNES